jgi:hypothetical protein
LFLIVLPGAEIQWPGASAGISLYTGSLIRNTIRE